MFTYLNLRKGTLLCHESKSIHERNKETEKRRRENEKKQFEFSNFLCQELPNFALSRLFYDL